MKVRLFAIATLIMVLLGACGGDGDGDEDTLLTGLSGVVIVGLVIFFVIRSRKNK